MVSELLVCIEEADTGNYEELQGIQAALLLLGEFKHCLLALWNQGPESQICFLCLDLSLGTEGP